MQLSDIGHIANTYWQEIPQHFPHAKIDDYVIMPNHIHSTVIIEKDNEGCNDTTNKCNKNDLNVTKNSVITAETQNFASPHTHQTQKKHNYKNTFGPQSRNVSSLIRGFKSFVKKYATMNNIGFFWQPRFHDHIIRNEHELNRIRQYIRSNQLHWNNDTYFEE